MSLNYCSSVQIWRQWPSGQGGWNPFANRERACFGGLRFTVSFPTGLDSNRLQRQIWINTSKEALIRLIHTSRPSRCSAFTLCLHVLRVIIQSIHQLQTINIWFKVHHWTQSTRTWAPMMMELNRNWKQTFTVEKVLSVAKCGFERCANISVLTCSSLDVDDRTCWSRWGSHWADVHCSCYKNVWSRFCGKPSNKCWCIQILRPWLVSAVLQHFCALSETCGFRRPAADPESVEMNVSSDYERLSQSKYWNILTLKWCFSDKSGEDELSWRPVCQISLHSFLLNVNL